MDDADAAAADQDLFDRFRRELKAIPERDRVVLRLRWDPAGPEAAWLPALKLRRDVDVEEQLSAHLEQHSARSGRYELRLVRNGTIIAQGRIELLFGAGAAPVAPVVAPAGGAGGGEGGGPDVVREMGERLLSRALAREEERLKKLEEDDGGDDEDEEEEEAEDDEPKWWEPALQGLGVKVSEGLGDLIDWGVRSVRAQAELREMRLRKARGEKEPPRVQKVEGVREIRPVRPEESPGASSDASSEEQAS